MRSIGMVEKTKLDILSNADYMRLTRLLNPHLARIIEQESFYIDTETYKLFQAGCTLRLRFESILYPLSDIGQKCSVETRGRMEMSQGVIGFIEKDEAIEVEIGRDMVSRVFLPFPSSVNSLNETKMKYSISEDIMFVGGLKNMRLIFSWHSLQLELDKFTHTGGLEGYQLQYWPSSKTGNEIMELLDQHGIHYKPSGPMKFMSLFSHLIVNVRKQGSLDTSGYYCCQESENGYFRHENLPNKMIHSTTKLIESENENDYSHQFAEKTLDIEDLILTYAERESNECEIDEPISGEIMNDQRKPQKLCDWAKCINANDTKTIETLQKKRSCIASAKYRRKKQLELQKLQASVEDLTLERERLLKRLEKLEDENRHLHKRLLVAVNQRI